MGRRVADRRREEEVAPRLAVRLRVLEADGLEALADGARRLVAGQEALAGQDHGIGGLDELVRVLFQAHLRRRGARGRALLRRERLRRHERRRRRAEGQGEDGGLHRGEPAGRGARGEWCKASRRARCAFFPSAAMAVDATGARIARFFGQRDAPSMSIAALGSGPSCAACASRVRPLLATRCCSRRF